MSTRAADSRIEAATLCRLLGDWSDTGRTLPEALASAIGELVEASVLRDGALLPSQRALADALGVSRVTVAEAYELDRNGDIVNQIEHIRAAGYHEVRDLATTVTGIDDPGVGDPAGAERVHEYGHGLRDADGVGQLDLASVGQARGDDIFRDISCCISG